MKEKEKSSKAEEMDWKGLRSRLDAIVLLLLPAKFSDKNADIKISVAAPFLHSVGYTPKEIADLFGKKDATQIAPYLYPKKK